MKKLRVLCAWGLLISFLGSLPPGVMNLVAVQVADQQGSGAALLYATGSMLAEVIVVRFALAGMKWLTRSRVFFALLEWMTAGMLLLFSAACFLTADPVQSSPLLPRLSMPAFFTGAAISIINPLHIPFWMGWSTVLMNKGILSSKPEYYNWYILGIALGTMAGFIVFIYGGAALLRNLDTHSLFIHCLAGLLLSVMAFLHIRKLIRVPAARRQAKLFRQTS